MVVHIAGLSHCGYCDDWLSAICNIPEVSACLLTIQTMLVVKVTSLLYVI